MDTITQAHINKIYKDLKSYLDLDNLKTLVVGSPDWEKDITYDSSGNITRVLNKKDKFYIRQDFTYTATDEVEQVACYVSENYGINYSFLGMEVYTYDSDGNLTNTDWFKGQYHEIAATPKIDAPVNGAVNTKIVPTIVGRALDPTFLEDQRMYREFQIDTADTTTTDFDVPVRSKKTNHNEWRVEEALDSNQPYKVRIRDVFETGKTSWSDVHTFQTGDYYVEAPDLTIEGEPDTINVNPTITGSTYTLTPTDTTDYHEATDWVVIRTSDNAVVYESLEDSDNLESIDLPGQTLNTDTEYKFRARYKSSIYGYSAWGEAVQKTAEYYVETPTLTVETDGDGKVGRTPELNGSSFSTVGTDSDTHRSTDWRIRRTSDDSVVWLVEEDMANLTSIEVPAGELSESTEYKFEVRYEGDTYGWSEWESVTATTVDSFCPVSITDHGPGPGCLYLQYDETTDTGYYGYVGSGEEPTYSSGTTYSIGDIVNDGSDEFYRSKTDSNTGNSLPAVGESNTDWEWIGQDVLITGDSLATDIGLSAGTSQYSDSGWLKFFIGATADCNDRHGTVESADRVVYIAKKTYRNDLSWDHIYDAGAVYGTSDNGTANSGSTTTQDASITVGTDTFNVRILTGSAVDPAAEEYNNQQCSDDAGGGSEWNDLFYRVHTDEPDCGDATIGMPGGNEDTQHGGPQDGENWANFTNAELQVYYTDAGDGTRSWCQEQGNDTARRVRRGYLGVAHFDANPSGQTASGHGWRPCLELT